MMVVDAGPAPSNSHPCAPATPNGSAGVAVTGCFIAAPTSETVTRTQALLSESTLLSGPSSAGATGADGVPACGLAAGESLRAGFGAPSGGAVSAGSSVGLWPADAQNICTNGCCMARSIN